MLESMGIAHELFQSLAKNIDSCLVGTGSGIVSEMVSIRGFNI